MNKASAWLLPTLCSLGFISAAAQAELVPSEMAPSETPSETVKAEAAADIEGWDPVRAASIAGAMDWCLANADATEADQVAYQLLSEGAVRALDTYIGTGDITAAEASLVSDRVTDQGYYMGLELTTAECRNLKNIVINWAPWQLVTSRDASFAIEMPSLPQRDTDIATIQGQDFEWLLYDAIVEPENNPLLAEPEYYLVGYTQLSEDFLADYSEDEIFEVFGQCIFDEMGFPELEDSTREETTDGVPSRVTIGEAYGQSVATVLYLVDDRLYLNLMVGQEQLHFERFFRSFEALDFVASAGAS